jgi:hypothetical protein
MWFSKSTDSIALCETLLIMAWLNVLLKRDEATGLEEFGRRLWA